MDYTKSEGAFYVNAGGGFGLTEILPINGVQSSSIMPFVFVEPGLDVRFSSNFSFDMTTRLISQFAPQIENSEFSGNRFIFRPQLSIHWYPLSTGQSRMFSRLTYNQDLSDNKLFVQVQFGYTLILGDGLRRN
ncbi:MAG: hypothetical protein HC817_15205 [Saprospiraceae bacterium]|nr:hypothetical protein [Saprospiraceae bacterium]